MLSFQSVTCKLGNMRKACDWTIYPKTDDATVTIQCDKRIAKVFLETGKTILSTGKGGHNGFMHLSPVFGAVEIDCPIETLEELRKLRNSIHQNNNGSGMVCVLG